MSYGGVIYDLIIAELLLFKKTLPIGIALSVFFHCSNKIVFNIGIFPWMMLASTTFYFSPDWPRKVLHFLTSKKFTPIPTRTFSQTPPKKLTILQWLIVIGLLVFLIHQILCPLRLHTYPGTVAWNEYGHQFSWRMKLRTKKCDSVGFAYNADHHIGFHLSMERLLNRRQYRKMSSRPDMIIQMAHYLGGTLDSQLRSYGPQFANTTTEVYIEVCIFFYFLFLLKSF